MAARRRLSAILAADVAGYSRLMGVDEEGTLDRLKAHRRELLDPKIREYRGRIVKTTGDGLLAEFTSVVDAVRCVVEVQRGMLDRDAGVGDDQRIRFRIGVNLGDIILDGGDIFGDGVNIAARLEALAEPGGICISRVVRDQIRDKLAYPFEDTGEQSVKNIARPVRVYALRRDAIAELPAPSIMPMARRRRAVAAAIGVTTAVAIAVAAGSWWLWPTPPSAPLPTVPPTITAASVALPAAAPRLSIVALPFANLTKDPEQQYLADGITEDLTTDLSRPPGMLVISRNTAFTYRNKEVDTKQIGRDLDVRYVLEGSVQRAGNRLRVNAQLIDAETDKHVWAERFERDAGDLFALQNEITGRLAVALNLALIGAEAARPPDNPNALDYILRGRAAYNRQGVTRDGIAGAISLFERALAIDPHSVEAQGWLARLLVARVSNQMSDAASADIARAEELIAQALAASPGSPIGHYAKGFLLSNVQQRCAEAIPEFEAVLASDRNFASAIVNLGRCRFWTGSIEAMIPAMEQSIRLSPRDPLISGWYLSIGNAHLLLSRTDEAILWLEKSRSANPALASVHGSLASAYAIKGESERAAAELAEARRLSRDGRSSSIARERTFSNFQAPNIHALAEATLFTGLRQAGMPEE